MKLASRSLAFLWALSTGLICGTAMAQRTVSFPLMDGSAQVEADVYDAGVHRDSDMRGLILAHGGRFNKESWKPQAGVFAKAGFLVIAVRFRGDRANPDGSPSAEGTDAENAKDVLAAAAYLRSVGVRRIMAIGGSLGGDAVGDAAAQSKPGSFERVVFLGSEGGDHPEKLIGRKLYIVAREDTSGDGPRLPGISRHYARAPEPKKLVLLEGSAHAQYLFPTEEGPRLMQELMRFLTAP